MNRYSRPFDNEIEHAVKSAIGKLYPEVASRGFLNVAIPNQSADGKMVNYKEGSGSNSLEYFLWGTTMWGGGRVVGS